MDNFDLNAFHTLSAITLILQLVLEGVRVGIGIGLEKCIGLGLDGFGYLNSKYEKWRYLKKMHLFYLFY